MFGCRDNSIKNPDCWLLAKRQKKLNWVWLAEFCLQEKKSVYQSERGTEKRKVKEVFAFVEKVGKRIMTFASLFEFH